MPSSNLTFSMFQAMENGQVEDLKVFGVMLHSHLLGVAVKLRLIRYVCSMLD